MWHIIQEELLEIYFPAYVYIIDRERKFFINNRDIKPRFLRSELLVQSEAKKNLSTREEAAS